MTAVIFDMDGLLIDSEPLWHQAEIAAFAAVGVTLTPRDCLQTTGLRVDAVVDHWLGSRPHDRAALAEAIVTRVVALVKERGVAKPGVYDALLACERRGFALALASSSARRIIDAVLARLGLGTRFSVVCSAEHEAHGKPHPAVYLTVARELGVAPADCIAVEDSPTGVRAAKAAGMRCIAVPDGPLVGDAGFSLADKVLSSLHELDGVLP